MSLLPCLLPVEFAHQCSVSKHGVHDPSIPLPLEVQLTGSCGILVKHVAGKSHFLVHTWLDSEDESWEGDRNVTQKT